MPTPEQLGDYEWWQKNAPEDSTHIHLWPDGKSQWVKVNLTGPFNFYWHKRFSEWQRKVSPDFGETIPRPSKPEPCKVCEESPCGHYNECPPGMPKTEAAKPYSNTGLPRVGANSENSGLVITCVNLQVKSWEVLATRKGEAVVYAPACEENGTDQAEVYLMSAAEFKDPRAEREREQAIDNALARCGYDPSEFKGSQRPERAQHGVFDAINDLYDAGMLRKGASDER